jgi:hypothetical protein
MVGNPVCMQAATAAARDRPQRPLRPEGSPCLGEPQHEGTRAAGPCHRAAAGDSLRTPAPGSRWAVSRLRCDRQAAVAHFQNVAQSDELRTLPHELLLELMQVCRLGHGCCIWAAPPLTRVPRAPAAGAGRNPGARGRGRGSARGSRGPAGGVWPLWLQQWRSPGAFLGRVASLSML